MPNCPTCKKSVYHAEKVTALGMDWACLKCKECGKALTPGAFNERDGIGYCAKPCYAKLFGPKASSGLGMKCFPALTGNYDYYYCCMNRLSMPKQCVRASVQGYGYGHVIDSHQYGGKSPNQSPHSSQPSLSGEQQP